MVFVILWKPLQTQMVFVIFWKLLRTQMVFVICFWTLPWSLLWFVILHLRPPLIKVFVICCLIPLQQVAAFVIWLWTCHLIMMILWKGNLNRPSLLQSFRRKMSWKEPKISSKNLKFHFLLKPQVVNSEIFHSWSLKNFRSVGSVSHFPWTFVHGKVNFSFPSEFGARRTIELLWMILSNFRSRTQPPSSSSSSTRSSPTTSP